MAFVVNNERWFLVSVCAALLGELIYLSGKKAAKTYHVQEKSTAVRDVLHYPLMLLRNVCLHPGAGVKKLASKLEEEPEWVAFGERLRVDPAEVHSQPMASWAVLRCSRVGAHELGGPGDAVR